MSKNTFYMSIIALIIFSLSMVHAADTSTVADFTLNNYDGKPYTLSQYKDASAIVIMFIATQCPVSNAYNDRMVELYNEYASKNVVFLGINSNKQEDVEEVKEHAKEHQFQFPVLKDPQNKIADKYQAQVTPEIFVVNSNRELLYHGRIDDSRREDEVDSHDLKNALDAILSGKQVEEKETKAFGCTIKKVN